MSKTEPENPWVSRTQSGAVVPPPPQTLGGLASLSSPYIECSGLWYNGQTVNLDGYRFVNCRFDNCTLNSNSGQFELINCFVDERTNVMHGANNMKVLRLFHRNNCDQDSIFSPQFNPDGTITIKC
ncbi:hypothetical protein AKJ18_13915 [Vibrio xuii]|nr:hypothetical protein AKJ18_13915 [Vibrio xuii]